MGNRKQRTPMVCSPGQDPLGEFDCGFAFGQGLRDPASNLPDEETLERKSKADERPAFSRLRVLPVRRVEASSDTGYAGGDFGGWPWPGPVSGERRGDCRDSDDCHIGSSG